MTILSVEAQKKLVNEATVGASMIREHLKSSGDTAGLALYRRVHAAARLLKEHLASKAGTDEDVTTFGGTPTPPEDDPA